MYMSSINNATKYDMLSQRFRVAYDWLAGDGPKTLPVGSYPLDGDKVVANIQEYETSPAGEIRFEAHDLYFDIQYMVSGKEIFGVCNRSTLGSSEVDAANDVSFFDDPELSTAVILLPGDFIVVAPEDAHKPRCAVEVPELVRKAVIKIRIAE